MDNLTIAFLFLGGLSILVFVWVNVRIDGLEKRIERLEREQKGM